MTDKLEYEIRRGERAEALLQDELLNDALETIKQGYMERWLTSPERDVEGRERLRLMVKTVDLLRAEIQSVLDTGKLAKQTLRQRASETLRRFS